jgi:ubiquinone/menaquinone biosynthesis C-methylase UbiE
MYNRWVVPTLINLAMTRDEATRLRVVHVPAASGVVLEVGIGSGLNLPHYTRAVTQLYGVDPSRELLAMAREKAAAAPFPVELFNCAADRIPLPDASVDTVVITWSLCSIVNTEDALREMHRVLKPGGTLIFVEHGLSPDASVRKWQNRLTPFWRVFTGGCHLNRKMDDLVRGAGFTIADLRTEYMQGLRALTFTYEGRARTSEERKTKNE